MKKLNKKELIERYKYIEGLKNKSAILIFAILSLISAIALIINHELIFGIIFFVISILCVLWWKTEIKKLNNILNQFEEGNFTIYLDKIVEFPIINRPNEFKTETYTKHINEAYSFSSDKINRLFIKENENAIFIFLKNADRGVFIGTDANFEIDVELHSNISSKLPDNLRIRSLEFNY